MTICDTGRLALSSMVLHFDPTGRTVLTSSPLARRKSFYGNGDHTMSKLVLKVDYFPSRDGRVVLFLEMLQPILHS